MGGGSRLIIIDCNTIYTQFLRTVESIWFRSEEEEAVETSFIVVGPMTKPHQETTGNMNKISIYMHLSVLASNYNVIVHDRTCTEC